MVYSVQCQVGHRNHIETESFYKYSTTLRYNAASPLWVYQTLEACRNSFNHLINFQILFEKILFICSPPLYFNMFSLRRLNQ